VRLDFPDQDATATALYLERANGGWSLTAHETAAATA
jgi:hypothetical protein